MYWYNQFNSKIRNSILSDWQSLLNENLPERYYQTFLTKNAGLFLGNKNCHLVISKLKLGSELETDFVTLTDGFSNGNEFELIEIKQPNVKLFTKNGLVGADLNKAIQQIRDWKRWLIDNKSWFKKNLPTDTTRVILDSKVKFKIIIGRRLVNQYEIEKRNQIANEIGAEIRSFDYLTDKFKSQNFYPTAWLGDEKRIYEVEMANPFFEAMTDSEWKKFCNNGKLSTFHFYSEHSEEILKRRKYNKKYQKH